jgi:hypothetical protein
VSFKAPKDWGDRIAELLGAGFLIGVVLEVIGAVVNSRLILSVGAALMAPLFIGIIFGLSAIGAEKAQECAEAIFGKGLVPKIAFWVVFGLIACMFLFAGSAEFSGPHFWGSID